MSSTGSSVQLSIVISGLCIFLCATLVVGRVADENVYGKVLSECSVDPMTGFYRNGKCSTGEDDRGTHTVCAEMTEEFLTFTRNRGNDLSTPHPQWGFPGLKPGNRWCLCVMRWNEAYLAGSAPLVLLEATNKRTLSFVGMEDLLTHAVPIENVAITNASPTNRTEL